MGAWGIGNFENDDGLDLLYEAENGADRAVLEALNRVTPGDGDFIEAPDAGMALAAAELVAAKLGRPAAELPDETAAILVQLSVTSEIQALALRAVDRITQKSELKELWEETGDFETWLATQSDLKKRLS